MLLLRPTWLLDLGLDDFKMNDFWILNGLIVTQDSHRRALQAHLHIIDGRIAEITKTPPKRLAKNSSNKIDARGLTILPGFVQAHVHLCQTLFRNQADDLELMDWLSQKIWKMEAAHTHESLYVSALLGVHELLSSGTTCILDMGTVRHTEAILEAVRETGIRASVGKCLMDHPKTTPPALLERRQDALAESLALYKRWNGKEGDRIRISYAPRFVISCTEQLLSDVKLLAKEQKALIHTHASENLKEIQLIKRRVHCENVEYLNQLGLTSPRLVLAHCIWLKPNEKEILKATGTHVVHCPSSNLKLASGIAHIPDLRKRGINVALGADGAPCNNNLNMFTEMRLAALIHKPGAGPKAMRAQEVLDMATRGGAKALGWWKDIGSIEVGKKADLIALDLLGPENTLPSSSRRSPPSPSTLASSIVYSTQASHVVWTMVDGKQIYRRGNFLGTRRTRLMEQVRKAQKQIHQRMETAKGFALLTPLAKPD